MNAGIAKAVEEINSATPLTPRGQSLMVALMIWYMYSWERNGPQPVDGDILEESSELQSG